MNGLKAMENKIIAITRHEYDAREFSQLVSRHGGRTIALPTLELVPKGPAPAELLLKKLKRKKYDYCAFMSAQAANILINIAGKRVATALRSTMVIAVGPKTKQVLRQIGVKVRLMPTNFSSQGLADLLSAMDPKGKRIIIPRSGAANKTAAKLLEDLGMVVEEVPLYTVRSGAVTFAWKEFSDLLWQKKVSAVVFTSASSVNSFFEILAKVSAATPQLDDVTKVVSIGPFTTKELEKRKVKCFESEEHTIMGTLDLVMRIV